MERKHINVFSVINTHSNAEQIELLKDEGFVLSDDTVSFPSSFQMRSFETVNFHKITEFVRDNVVYATYNHFTHRWGTTMATFARKLAAGESIPWKYESQVIMDRLWATATNEGHKTCTAYTHMLNVEVIK